MNALLSTKLAACMVLGISSLRAQDPPIPPARIVGSLPDGSKTTAPQTPKPRLMFHPDDVLCSRTESAGDHTITFQKVTPIALPAIPQEQPSAPLESQGQAVARGSEQNEAKLVFLGATTYLSNDLPDHPRSLVRFWPTLQSAPVSLWVNANFLWLTGFGDFEAGSQRYSLLMAVSKDEAGSGDSVSCPTFTDDSKASIIVAEGSPTLEELAPINALVSLYNSEKQRLQEAYEGRLAEAAQQAEERRLNPPQKKNLVLKYWRVDRAGQEGATLIPAEVR